MTRKSAYTYILLLIVLLAAMVVPASATDLVISANHDGYVYEATPDAVFPTMRNSAGDGSIDSSATEIQTMIAAASTTDLYNVVYRGVATINGSDLPDDAIIDSAVVSFYKASSIITLGNYSIGLIDIAPPNYVDYANTDYSTTTFARMSDTDLYGSTFATNATMNYILNAGGLAKINKTANFAFGLAMTPDIDNVNVTWLSGSKSSGTNMRSVLYDGAMLFAYQFKYGANVWNGYDSPSDNYAEEVFTYPAADHPISTVQWEGISEAVVDSQIADELTRRSGSRAAALTIINAGIAAGVDMSVIRGNLIDAILFYGDTVRPTASFTKNRPVVVIPQLCWINDTSSNTPTMWNISWGDSSWSNSTENGNQSHTYRRPALYTINMTVSNAAGSSSAESRIWVYRISAIAPYREGYVSCEAGTFSLSREITPLEYLMTEAKIAALCQ